MRIIEIELEALRAFSMEAGERRKFSIEVPGIFEIDKPWYVHPLEEQGAMLKRRLTEVKENHTLGRMGV